MITLLFLFILTGDPVLYQHLFLMTLSVILINVSCFFDKISLSTANAKFDAHSSPFNFSKFYQLFKEQYPNAKAPSPNFLEWFIGFLSLRDECDGSCFVNSRGYPCLVITQSTADLQILLFIQKILGFGRVIQQSPTTSRFIVEDRQNLAILVALLNGNFVLPVKHASFIQFLDAFNKRNTFVELIPTLVLPTLYDFWLAGFTDAEGCFTCSFLSNSLAYRFRFIIAQKGILNLAVLQHITTLIGGTVAPHHIPEVNQITVNGVRNMTGVFNYFDNHALLTKKARSYAIWKEIHLAIINKEHLVPESRALLKAKAATINH